MSTRTPWEAPPDQWRVWTIHTDADESVLRGMLDDLGIGRTHYIYGVHAYTRCEVRALTADEARNLHTVLHYEGYYVRGAPVTADR